MADNMHEMWPRTSMLLGSSSTSQGDTRGIAELPPSSHFTASASQGSAIAPLSGPRTVTTVPRYQLPLRPPNCMRKRSPACQRVARPRSKEAFGTT